MSHDYSQDHYGSNPDPMEKYFAGLASKILDLEQKLASRDAEIANLAALGSSYLNRANAAELELDGRGRQVVIGDDGGLAGFIHF